MSLIRQIFDTDFLRRHKEAAQKPLVAEIIDARVDRSVNANGKVTYRHTVPVYVCVKTRKSVLVAGHSDDPLVKYPKPGTGEQDDDAFFEYEYKPGRASDEKKAPTFSVVHLGQESGCPVTPHSVEARLFLTNFVGPNSGDRYGYGNPDDSHPSNFSCE